MPNQNRQFWNINPVFTNSPRNIGPLLLMLVLVLTSCNYPGLTQPTLGIIPAPTGTKVHLPDTWTVQPPTGTSQISPSASPTSTTALTDTSTGTSTPESGPTQVLEATPTIDIIAEPYPDCRYIADNPGLRLQIAPFVDPYRVLPTMEPGKAYQAVIDKPTFTLLLENGQPAGWVDYRLIGLDLEGTQCLSRQLEREITEFHQLCFFSPNEQIEAYSNRDLTEYRLDLYPDSSYVLLLQYQDAYFSAFGHAGPSFYVSPDAVFTSGDCQSVPSGGTIIQNTQLYSQPGISDGSVIYSLIAGQNVYIQAKKSPGNPPPEASTDGEWVQIRVPTNTGGVDGWCWSEFLDYN